MPRERTPLGADAADLDAVETIVQRAGTSFYRGMRILPPDRRAAMYAVYAFCRLVDDVADEPAPSERRRAGLDAWRVRIEALYRPIDARAAAPLDRVLARAIHRFGLRRADFLAVIDGMQMDAEGPVVAPDLATLDLYCDRVAAAVGRLSVRAFGDASPAADGVAHALGRALQLTNILRDLDADASDGRLYLPREWLDDAGVPASPEGALASPALPLVCARVAAAARAQFADARRAMRRCRASAMRPARVMGATYAALLDAVEARGFAERQRVSVPSWRKATIALAGLIG